MVYEQHPLQMPEHSCKYIVLCLLNLLQYELLNLQPLLVDNTTKSFN